MGGGRLDAVKKLTQEDMDRIAETCHRKVVKVESRSNWEAVRITLECGHRSKDMSTRQPMRGDVKWCGSCWIDAVAKEAGVRRKSDAV